MHVHLVNLQLVSLTSILLGFLLVGWSPNENPCSCCFPMTVLDANECRSDGRAAPGKKDPNAMQYNANTNQQISQPTKHPNACSFSLSCICLCLYVHLFALSMISLWSLRSGTNDGIFFQSKMMIRIVTRLARTVARGKRCLIDWLLHNFSAEATGKRYKILS